MADDKKMSIAKEVYKKLISVIENNSWQYDKDDEHLIIHFVINGKDVPMKLIFVVDVERQLVRLLSPMPFNFGENNRLDGAIAACVASYGLADGNFDYDLTKGSIVFRMTASFTDSVIGESLLKYMIFCSLATVDAYNDKFLAIEKGYLSIDDFINKKS